MRRPYEQRRDRQSDTRRQPPAASLWPSVENRTIESLLESAPEAMKLINRIIGKANREFPADGVLRTELKSKTGLPRSWARVISRAVFAYYRWLGWLDRSQPALRQICEAMALTDRFASAPESFSDEELIAKAAPPWVAEHFTVTAAWLRCLQTHPVLWLRAQRAHAEAVALELGDCEPIAPGRGAGAFLYRGETDLFRSAPFQRGEFELQDIHSQAVGWLCAPEPGQTWWDACAGEGGKLLHLSDLMGNKGSIWATDRAEWRLARLKMRAARAKAFNYRSAIWDGGPTRPFRVMFDGVLVDAPCSNLGTWHRNPHARWTTTPNDVLELAQIQKNLLANVVSGIKPGGKLVYSACTLTREETDQVADDFEKRFEDFEPLPAADPFELKPGPTARHLFLPQETGGSGMFVAVWRRKPAPAKPVTDTETPPPSA